jgi:hypothetical protein
VMREKFSAVVRKPVYTFRFDRFAPVEPLLLRKLQKAIRMCFVSVPSLRKLASESFLFACCVVLQRVAVC